MNQIHHLRKEGKHFSEVRKLVHYSQLKNQEHKRYGILIGGRTPKITGFPQ